MLLLCFCLPAREGQRRSKWGSSVRTLREINVYLKEAFNYMHQTHIGHTVNSNRTNLGDLASFPKCMFDVPSLMADQTTCVYVGALKAKVAQNELNFWNLLPI